MRQSPRDCHVRRVSIFPKSTKFQVFAIAVNNSEIQILFSISIATGMAVTTKAKLESVTVGGDCACGDAPPPPPRPVTPPPGIEIQQNLLESKICRVIYRKSTT